MGDIVYWHFYSWYCLYVFILGLHRGYYIDWNNNISVLLIVWTFYIGDEHWQLKTSLGVQRTDTTKRSGITVHVTLKGSTGPSGKAYIFLFTRLTCMTPSMKSVYSIKVWRVNILHLTLKEKLQSEESSWIPDHSNTVVFKRSDITLRVAHNSTAVDHLVRRTFYMR